MSLIKTPQHWLHVAIDGALTLGAWASFVYLLVRGFEAMADASRNGPQLDFLHELIRTCGTLAAYALCATLIGLLLFAWAKYNEIRARRYARRQRMPDISAQTLSKSFRITSETYLRLRAQQVLTLHNDQVGDLIWVEEHIREDGEDAARRSSETSEV
ncbi:poly-beta-1,6-N-acetyl-D-glucosamine biosynthesis protein PgaD [Pseudomonas citronellolis]|uniref:poly-beta-1,6-N-acetyl-D-glucosamine biosynthesis protein PgaD n=1 Tax=Pseudomonas citronellolis TaxID=53408 RepID=UPI0023E44ABF|nr:poly-beta-1,6-N-acetyl-D-glucosamine biosynthesis protein PgaD [Pseudomonas citronellolis]MDF3931063.1 poly-beta-1,6-N-acetyl-D-glucosamine biosynthesis protein PgaD [Pseudomonas citronellolis]